MTPEEKIREEAESRYQYLKEDVKTAPLYVPKLTSFILGAKSDAAKEYHTKDLLSKEDILSFFDEYIPDLLVDALKQDFENWIENKKK